MGIVLAFIGFAFSGLYFRIARSEKYKTWRGVNYIVSAFFFFCSVGLLIEVSK